MNDDGEDEDDHHEDGESDDEDIDLDAHHDQPQRSSISSNSISTCESPEVYRVFIKVSSCELSHLDLKVCRTALKVHSSRPFTDFTCCSMDDMNTLGFPCVMRVSHSLLSRANFAM